MSPDDLLAPPGDPSAGRVRVRWLGTAGYELEADGHVVLVDPYVSRIGLWQAIRGPVVPDLAAIDREVRRADAVFVGHSHFDHAMDVPAIALRTGARVYGSRSTANLCLAAGVPAAQVVPCEGREVVDVGPFKVTLVPSAHSPFGLGRKVPFAGDIPISCEIPMRATRYRCGQCFGFAIEVAGLTLYHMGSAELREDEVRHRDVDLLFLCIAARHYTERFLPRTFGRLRPRVVLPTHYDNFFRPAAAPLRTLPLVQFGAFVDEATALDRDVVLKTLPIGGEMRLG
jgi:L-ascorbate metabolism protein UlaG (beta-lactamase superfamily)